MNEKNTLFTPLAKRGVKTIYRRLAGLIVSRGGKIMRSRSQRIQSDRIIERRRRASLGSRLAGPVLAALIWLVVAPTAALAQTTFVVTRTDDPAPDGCAIGDCSLREAIIAANAAAGADMITFASPGSTYTLTIMGQGENASATGDLDITDALTIQGNSGSIIQAGVSPGTGIDRVFDVVAAVSVTFSGVTIRHGTIAGDGGGVFSNVASNITISNTTVANNQATSGGGIYKSTGQLTLSSATVSGNSTTSEGGGIRCINCTLNLLGSLVSGNIANDTGAPTDDGGGISAELASTVTIQNSAITSNQAGDQGGGVYIINTSTATISGTNIAGNSGGTGGNTGDGIAAGNTANVTVSLSRFHNNGTGFARQNTTTVVAMNNWWGCDGFPGAAGCDGVVNLDATHFDPRIDLRLIA
ncbi:MAG TPA: right-handed parallel beta-helix repeat-containing protein, partial [Vicinamibacteria bacterium]|nr:right-handed parallel beta-helix repeat-containing protein [Vicinamibacteria bacterium]